jgi:hypothetical protein
MRKRSFAFLALLPLLACGSEKAAEEPVQEPAQPAGPNLPGEDLLLPARRFGYGADEKGKRGPKVSEIVYENVRFGVPLDEALFQHP